MASKLPCRGAAGNKAHHLGGFRRVGQGQHHIVTGDHAQIAAMRGLGA